MKSHSWKILLWLYPNTSYEIRKTDLDFRFDFCVAEVYTEGRGVQQM